MTLLCACGRPATCVVDVSTERAYQRSPLCQRCIDLSHFGGASVDVVIDPDMMQMLPGLKGSVCWCGPKGLRVAWCPTHGTLTKPVTSSAKSDKECPRQTKRLRQRHPKG